MFANFDLLPYGTGNYSESDTSFDTDYDYALSYGIGGGVEFRMGRIFALSLMPRYFWSYLSGTNLSNQEAAGNFDFVVSPTFRIPVGPAEILLPINIGPSFMFPPGDTGDGYGVMFGFTPGVIVWFNRFVGIHANFGYEGHVLAGTAQYYDSFYGYYVDTTWTDVYHMFRMTFGVSFGLGG